MATRSGGTFVSIGRGAKDELSIPFFETMDREVDVIGVFRYRHAYPKAIAMLAAGLINVSPLISHHFELQDAQDAFEMVEKAADGAIKVMLTL